MFEAKVSWILMGKVVLKADNVIHFAYLVQQVSVDMFYD